jgi:protein-tyrosine kinase
MSNTLTVLSLTGPPTSLNGHAAPPAPARPAATPNILNAVGTALPLVATRPDPRAEEQYRIIRTKLLQRYPNGSMLVVSSPGAGDGKTITALHLAATLAASAEERVLLLEADLRRPSMRRYLPGAHKIGLRDVLQGTGDLDAGMVTVEAVPNLCILLAGEATAGPAELLSSSQWRDLVTSLRARFRWVIVDSPPIGAVADFDLIYAVCDGVVLVLRPDHSDRTLAFEAIKTLGPKLSGIVMNGLDEWFLWKPYRHSAYYYAGDKPPKRRGQR